MNKLIIEKFSHPVCIGKEHKQIHNRLYIYEVDGLTWRIECSLLQELEKKYES